MSRRAGPEHYGEEIGESAEDKAQRLIEEELMKRRWREEHMLRLRKGDPKKVKIIALRLRQETTMTLAWIARRLDIGTKSHLTHLLYWQNRKAEAKSGQY